MNVTDGQESVFGYGTVMVNNDDFKDKDWAKITNAIAFLSSPVQLVRDDIIDLADTYYQLKWQIDRSLDIKRGVRLVSTAERPWPH